MGGTTWRARGLRALLALVIAVTGTAFAANPASALGGSEPPTGVQGCTPGFWKQSQHFQYWTTVSPGDSYRKRFWLPGWENDLTLLQALNRGGGGEAALGRHAVAALLNARSPDVAYPLTADQVIQLVLSATVSGNFESAKTILEGYNEGGACTAKP